MIDDISQKNIREAYERTVLLKERTVLLEEIGSMTTKDRMEYIDLAINYLNQVKKKLTHGKLDKNTAKFIITNLESSKQKIDGQIKSLTGHLKYL